MLGSLGKPGVLCLFSALFFMGKPGVFCLFSVLDSMGEPGVLSPVHYLTP